MAGIEERWIEIKQGATITKAKYKIEGNNVTEQPRARKTILTVTDDFSGYTKDIPATINIYLTETATKPVATATVKVIDMPFKLVFFKTDHLGTPRVITDQDGKVLSTHDYLAYGEELTDPEFTTNRMKFTGHERDPETGLDYMLARYYTSGSGRFLQVDPGGDYDHKDPMSWNLYNYCRSNPVMLCDPTGTTVNLSSLTPNQRKLLLLQLASLTGYKTGRDKDGNEQGLYIDKDGNLQIAKGAVADTKNTSETARNDLGWYTSEDSGMHTLYSVKGPLGETILFGAKDLKINSFYIDFSDHKQITYKGLDPMTYGVGTTFFHEAAHEFYGLRDENDPGNYPTSMQHVNLIRSECNLPERTSYIINTYYSPTPLKKAGVVLYKFKGGGSIRFNPHKLAPLRYRQGSY